MSIVSHAIFRFSAIFDGLAVEHALREGVDVGKGDSSESEAESECCEPGEGGLHSSPLWEGISRSVQNCHNRYLSSLCVCRRDRRPLSWHTHVHGKAGVHILFS